MTQDDVHRRARSPLYRDFFSQAEIDAQYDVPRSVEDPAPYRALLASKSAQARGLGSARLGLRFGPTEAEYLDVYPAGADAPALLFVHGGYWRASSAREHAYAALGPLTRGVTVVITNYALCPDVDIAEITRQSRAAAAWVWSHAQELGIDRARIFAAGHSAGAQQVAMMLGETPSRAAELPPSVLQGGVGISGIYDLRPLRHSFLQPALRLTEDSAARQSPLLHLPSRSAPLLVTVGSEESDEFQRQSRDYAAARAGAELPGSFSIQGGRNHYTIAADLADPESSLCAELFAWMGLA
ncbi:MAG: alpha/beta hydrolase [Planctomycetota bacterium]